MSIYNALTTQLLTATGLPPLASPNIVFRPGNSAWCRATLLPAEPEDGSIGVNGFDWDRGLYQVDIFSPLNRGQALGAADAAMAVFPRGLRLTVEGYTHPLEVQRCWLSAMRQDESWHLLSISVRYKVPQDPGV